MNLFNSTPIQLFSLFLLTHNKYSKGFKKIRLLCFEINIAAMFVSQWFYNTASPVTLKLYIVLC